VAEITAKANTAMGAAIFRCHECGKLVRAGATTDEKKHLCCPRCYAALHFRKTNSITRTWALLLSSLVFIFPANLLPIMHVEYLGTMEHSTIMDGILYFLDEGDLFIGSVILVASVRVPLFKIIGLTLILLSIHFHWRTWLRHKATLFRFIRFIGRWSMLDIFVIALMSALVDFGTFSSTEAAPAAIFFTLVVICTMFAAITFDPRLLWDA
jgi:paraquat-inducible protein A